MEEYLKMLHESADYIRTHISLKPQIAIILGSDLGPVAGKIKNPQEIDYRNIPNFPITTVKGHAGKACMRNKGLQL